MGLWSCLESKRILGFFTMKNSDSSYQEFRLTSIIYKYYFVQEMGQAENCTVSLIKNIWQPKISLSRDYLTVIFPVNSKYIHVRQLMVLNSNSHAHPHSPKQCFGTISGMSAVLPGLLWWWVSQHQMRGAWLKQCRTSWPAVWTFMAVSVMSGPCGMWKFPVSPVYHDLHFGQRII